MVTVYLEPYFLGKIYVNVCVRNEDCMFEGFHIHTLFCSAGAGTGIEVAEAKERVAI